MSNTNAQNIPNYHIPRWSEIPKIDLYLDQTVIFLEKNLKNFIYNNDETIITKTMINNYVKQGLIKPPKKKKYSRTHIATLFVICILKQVYSINDIFELIKLAVKTARFDYAYNQFCEELENAITCVFEGIEARPNEDLTFERYLLKSVAQSFASKLYVEKTFLHK